MDNFNYKKKYGQNFLKDEEIVDKIVTSINPNEDDLIIEIGAGMGALTKKLKKYNSNLIAYEIDKETKDYLLPLEDKKTRIIFEDFLQADIKKHISEINHKNIYIIGNLPYYITTPIIEKIIELNLGETSLTIMVQKEVGQRFLAKPRSKQYGYMTVILNYWYTITKIAEAPKTLFYPIPKVDSLIIKLTRHKIVKTDYIKLKKIVKESFQFKRKTIGNNLKKYNADKLNAILLQHNANLKNRAEDLDLETFIDLSEQL